MRAMGDLLPYRTPKSRQDTTSYVGMIIFLASWAMMFAALFFSYVLVRLRSNVWPPADLPALPIGLAGLNTAVIALSSAGMQLALWAVRRGRTRLLTPAIGVATVLGSAFLALQIWSWSSVYEQGLTPAGGPFPSVFYGLTWFHALHVAVGLGALVSLWIRSLRGRFTPAKHRGIRLWALYWHFVGVVWALMYVLVYLI